MSVRRVLRFFGRSMFFGVGGLMVAPATIALNASAGASLTIPLAWAGFCIAWVLLGMIGRTLVTTGRQ